VGWFFVCDAGAVFLFFRWHPGFAFILLALPFGVLGLALASA